MADLGKAKDDLVIYQKYLDLVYYTYDLCRKYPKSEKSALVAETKQSLFNGVRNLICAYKEFNKKGKLVYLNQLDVELKLQKVYIRLAFRYQFISKQNYETWSNKITDICNMLGGWIKNCLTR